MTTRRLKVTPVQKTGWIAHRCPLCGRTFESGMLLRHVDDHRRGRFGAELVDVRLEITMLVDDGKEAAS